MALVFCTYFVICYILENDYLSSSSLIYQHLQLIYQRPVDLKYNFVFTNEQLVTNKVQKDEGIPDLRAYYDNEVYENSRQIFSSLQSTFPS